MIGFLMFSCGLPARACWAELNYDRILSAGSRGFELWLLKVQKNLISSIFSLTGWQVLRAGQIGITANEKQWRKYDNSYLQFVKSWKTVRYWQVQLQPAAARWALSSSVLWPLWHDCQRETYSWRSDTGPELPSFPWWECQLLNTL